MYGYIPASSITRKSLRNVDSPSSCVPSPIELLFGLTQNPIPAHAAIFVKISIFIESTAASALCVRKITDLQVGYPESVSLDNREKSW